ncbi:hypothetical protein L208DRAFT_1362514 [Tricholoma matsutake]|nr:hypothetical protein L208DRAFT_1362514 [Tricholoma matsutake 945]
MGGQTTTQTVGGHQPRTKPTPPLLLPEILGFSPQLLLDDIINIANNAVQDGVNGMEEFLQKWVDERAAREAGDWDSTQEVEQGLVAFQTLLEYHTDIAFDFFEAWSLRNIFAIPYVDGEGDLPVVVPHQEGLDLTCTAEREQEQELMDECEELRRKIDNQRRLKRLYTRARHASAAQRRKAERRLSRLSMLKSPSLDLLNIIPHKLTAIYQSASSLPPMDSSSMPVTLVDPGKRPWETNKAGYVNWAVRQLVERTKEEEGKPTGKGNSKFDVLSAKVEDIGSSDGLKRLVEAGTVSGEGSSPDRIL